MDRLEQINNPEDFARVTSEIMAEEGYVQPAAFAIGLARYANDGTMLDTYFPHANLLGEASGTAALFQEAAGSIKYTSETGVTTIHTIVGIETIDRLLHAYHVFANDGKKHPNIDALERVKKMLQGEFKTTYGSRRAVMVFIYKLDEPPTSTQDAYLRLHLLSMLKAKPRSINLDGIFPLLPIASRTRQVGPVKKEEFDAVNLQHELTTGERLVVESEDRFPRMVDFVQSAEGVRIPNPTNVRLGAHLAPGTTVMHAGFVNFNAGTLGACMVEGRISAGVVVGAGSDIGGGASIMGTLSGGGKEQITIGENCLIGANGGTGISLGNNCKIEAGLYLTVHTEILMPNGHCVKAKTLSGQNSMTFFRNRVGRVEVHQTNGKVELNPMLHG